MYREYDSYNELKLIINQHVNNTNDINLNDSFTVYVPKIQKTLHYYNINDAIDIYYPTDNTFKTLSLAVNVIFSSEPRKPTFCIQGLSDINYEFVSLWICEIFRLVYGYYPEFGTMVFKTNSISKKSTPSYYKHLVLVDFAFCNRDEAEKFMNNYVLPTVHRKFPNCIRLPDNDTEFHQLPYSIDENDRILQPEPINHPIRKYLSSDMTDVKILPNMIENCDPHIFTKINKFTIQKNQHESIDNVLVRLTKQLAPLCNENVAEYLKRYKQVVSINTPDHSLNDYQNGYIYFIAEEPFNNKVKIGMSQNPQRRLKELQTGNPNTLVLRHVTQYDEYKALERTMHEICKDLRGVGEWFDITESELTGLVSAL